MSIINEQIRLFLDESDMIAAFSNVSACIMMNYDRLNWAGFYFVRNGELVLGPFQGKPACTHIPFDKRTHPCSASMTCLHSRDILPATATAAANSASPSS